MFSDFLDATTTPKTAKEDSTLFSYMSKLPFVNIYSPLLTIALEAISLGYFGTSKKDQRLINASRESYGSALARLRSTLSSEITRSSLQVRRETLLAILVVSHFDRCVLLPTEEYGNWKMHFWAAQKYVQACGPSSFDSTHFIDQVMVPAVHVSGLLLGIGHRRALNLGSVRSFQRSNSTISLDGVAELVEVPALLQSADILLSDRRGPVDDDVRSLCCQLEEIHYRLQGWLDGMLAGPYNDFVKVIDNEAFDMQIEEHCFLSTTTTFSSHLRFPQPQDAIYFALPATIQLIINCTLLRIYHFRQATTSVPHLRQVSEVEHDTMVTARQLCRTVHYISQLRSMAYAYWITHMIQLVQNFSAEQQAVKELGWCQACLIATRTRLRRIKATSSPTLCRVADLPAGFAAAGRYRTRTLGTEIAPVMQEVRLPP